MGSSKPSRLTAIFGQLQKRRYWCQAVVSFLKTTEENPSEIGCCEAF